MNVLKRPIISEKSIKETEKGRFTFEVSRESNKRSIRKAVEEVFSVQVLSASTRIVKGKSKRFGRRREEVKESSYKKATVKLAPGQKIPLFETSGNVQK